METRYLFPREIISLSRLLSGTNTEYASFIIGYGAQSPVHDMNAVGEKPFTSQYD